MTYVSYYGVANFNNSQKHAAICSEYVATYLHMHPYIIMSNGKFHCLLHRSKVHLAIFWIRNLINFCVRLIKQNKKHEDKILWLANFNIVALAKIKKNTCLKNSSVKVLCIFSEFLADVQLHDKNQTSNSPYIISHTTVTSNMFGGSKGWKFSERSISRLNQTLQN